MPRTPIAGINANAVSSVPAMLPAVEIAYRTPAVLPTVARSVAASLIATGEVMPSSRLGSTNKTTEASKGLARGPRSQAENISRMCRDTHGPAGLAVTNQKSVGRRNDLHPVHIRHQDVRHPDGTVFLLIVLQHGNQRPARGHRGPVESVRIDGAFGAPHTDPQPAGLKVGAVADGRGLSILASGGHPGLHVICLG